MDFLDETGGTREEVKVIVDEYLNGYELNHNQTNYVQSFVHPKFIEAGGDAVRKADSYIVEITGTHESVKALIIEYIEFYNKKLIASNEASIEWKSLRKTLLATQE